MSDVSAAIPQETKDYMQAAKEKIFDSDKLRPTVVFFGIGEPTQSFSVVCMPSDVFSRVKHNILFFYLNYIVLTAIVFILTMLTVLISPKSLITLGVLAVAWFVVMRATSSGSAKVLGVKIPRKEASLAMMLISGLVMFFLLQTIFFVGIGSSAFLVIAHAWFRDSSMHVLEDKKLEGTIAEPLELGDVPWAKV